MAFKPCGTYIKSKAEIVAEKLRGVLHIKKPSPAAVQQESSPQDDICPEVKALVITIFANVLQREEEALQAARQQADMPRAATSLATAVRNRLIKTAAAMKLPLAAKLQRRTKSVDGDSGAAGGGADTVDAATGAVSTPPVECGDVVVTLSVAPMAGGAKAADDDASTVPASAKLHKLGAHVKQALRGFFSCDVAQMPIV